MKVEYSIDELRDELTPMFKEVFRDCDFTSRVDDVLLMVNIYNSLPDNQKELMGSDPWAINLIRVYRIKRITGSGYGFMGKNAHKNFSIAYDIISNGGNVRKFLSIHHRLQHRIKC